MFDILNRFLAVIMLLLLSPALIIISLLIFIDDGFPILFVQKRVGEDYSFFEMYKFRTMKKDTPNVATHLLTKPEKYILKIGRFLRKLSLDELPNLINIAKGEMVFVGPRPALYNQDDLMELRVKYKIDKLKPGLTGWAQVNGRDEISTIEKIKFEQEYLEKKSFWFDVLIIFKTFTTAFFGKNIVH